MAGRSRVLITRPDGSGQALARSLQRAGFDTVHVPCLAIEPREFPHQPAEIADLDTFSRVIVVSPTAAELLRDCIETYWPQWPIGVSWLATGRATAAVLEAIEPSLPVVVPAQGQENAAGLLALDQLQAVRDARVLIVKGEGGRPDLREGLIARGAEVRELDLYRRTCPWSQQPVLQELLRGRPPDVAIAHSGATLDNLFLLAGGVASRLRKVPICVPGERLERLARELGFEIVVPATGASADRIIEALRRWQNGDMQQGHADARGG